MNTTNSEKVIGKEAEASTSERRPSSVQKEPTYKASTEMLESIEKNWNNHRILEPLFNTAAKEFSETECSTTSHIIEKLFERKNMSSWQIACIAGAFATAAYNRGRYTKL